MVDFLDLTMKAVYLILKKVMSIDHAGNREVIDLYHKCRWHQSWMMHDTKKKMMFSRSHVDIWLSRWNNLVVISHAKSPPGRRRHIQLPMLPRMGWKTCPSKPEKKFRGYFIMHRHNRHPKCWSGRKQRPTSIPNFIDGSGDTHTTGTREEHWWANIEHCRH
jgi:hypothetical protein